MAAVINFSLKRKAYWLNGKQDETIPFPCARFNQCQPISLFFPKGNPKEENVGRGMRENEEGH